MTIEYKNKPFGPEREFKFMIKEYILPLLGIKNNNLLKCNDEIHNNNKQIISFYKDFIYFFPYKNSNNGYKLEVTYKYNNIDFTLVIKVLESLIKISLNKLGRSTKAQNYTTFMHCVKNYEYAVQDAICSYLMPENDHHNLNMLLKDLEEWSTKTYEGKKVPFGFLINLKEIKNDSFDYVNIINEEFSATITDGITSIVELDIYGNFIGYNSVIDKNIIEGCTLINCLPIRFAQIISKHVLENKIGVFLLSNGDIIIAKNQTIELVKRNGKWSNFNFRSFLNAMSLYETTSKIDDNLLKEVFSTSLDVSFAHSGGIIAIVDKWEDLKNVHNESILSPADNLRNGMDDFNLTKEMPNEKDYNIKKRLKKRQFLMRLTSENNSETSKQYSANFCNLDRRLRAELVGLDGATIINKFGDIIAFGAIIENEKGSSGGGRGAAAKKLSNFKGLAIKISTDGYIEVYINGEVKYFIK